MQVQATAEKWPQRSKYPTLPPPKKTKKPKKTKNKPKQLNTVLYTNSMGEPGFPTLEECIFVFTALNMENVLSY